MADTADSSSNWRRAGGTNKTLWRRRIVEAECPWCTDPARMQTSMPSSAAYLRDLAFAQSSQQKMLGYKRAASTILALDLPLTDLVGSDGALPRIAGIGPASTRVIHVTAFRRVTHRRTRDRPERPPCGHRASTPASATLPQPRRGPARAHGSSIPGADASGYPGTCKCTPNGAMALRQVREIADACLQRGYHYAAVTDHSYGLKIAGGMSMAEAAQQRRAIDDVNARHGNRFRLLQGIEANIDAAGQLDLSNDEAATFDVVLAAPHSQLRKDNDQTNRMLAAIAHPAVQDPCSPAWPDERIARGGDRQLGRGVCLGGSARGRDRNRRGSRTTGPRSHVGVPSP